MLKKPDIGATKGSMKPVVITKTKEMGKLDNLVKENETLKANLEAALDPKLKARPEQITITKSSKHREVTPVALLSDVHYEEVVDPDTVNGLNEYNPKIADKRLLEFFQGVVENYELVQSQHTIKNMVVALLGDMISGGIHPELMEGNAMLPIEAIQEMQKVLYNGIKFLLKETKANLTIPCSIGNHGRITEKPRVATAHGNNLEAFMYSNLAQFFKDEKRVKFVLGKAYHTYMQVYDKTLRLHHGDQVRYQGGVGGLYIPMNKAIAQWNKAKHADLDLTGHWHAMKDGGNFVSNGSVVGFGPYAVKIKADYETPKQAFVVIDSKHGKTIVSPINLT